MINGKDQGLKHAYKTGLWERLSDWLFGYDYFIAHRSADGKEYASALYDALTSEGNALDCFLDVKHYGAGGRLTWMQTRALRQTTRLIAIVTPRAHDPQAHYLWGEIEEFTKQHPNGIVVPIGTLETLSDTHYGDSRLLTILPHLPNDICVIESNSDLSDGNPSTETVTKLLNDFAEERQSTKRRRWIQHVVVVLVLLLFAASGFGVYAIIQANEANRLREAAEDEARIARSKALVAESRSVLQSEGDPTKSLELAMGAWALDASQDAAGAMFSARYGGSFLYAGHCYPTPRYRIIARFDDEGTDAFFLPGGETIAAVGGGWRTDKYETRLLRRDATVFARYPAVIGRASLIEDGNRLIVGGRIHTIGDERPDVLLEDWPRGHSSSIISPDGQLIAAREGKNVSIWAMDGRKLRTLDGHENSVVAHAFSPDSKQLVTGAMDSTAIVWNLEDGSKDVVLPKHGHHVTGAIFSPDGRFVLTWETVGPPRLWDRAGTLIAKGPDQGLDTIRGVQFLPDGKTVVLSWGKGTIQRWEYATNHVTLVDSSAVPARRLANDEHGMLVQSASSSAIEIWDRSPRKICDLRGHTFGVSAASFSPDGRDVVSTSPDRTVRLWNVRHNEVPSLPGGGAKFAPNSRSLLTVGPGRIARRWSLAGELLATYRHAPDRGRAERADAHEEDDKEEDDDPHTLDHAVYSPDAQIVATASEGGTLVLWSLDGVEQTRWQAHTSDIMSVAFSADGARLLTCSWDMRTRVWTREGEQLASWTFRAEDIVLSLFLADNEHVVCSYEGGLTIVYDLSGKTVEILNGERLRACSLRQPWFATVKTGGNIRIRDSVGELLQERADHASDVNTVRFSADGRYLLSASRDYTARLHDLVAGDSIVLRGHQAEIVDASFSDDNRWIVTGSEDGDVRVWGRSGRLLARIQEPAKPLWQLAVSPDGRYIVTRPHGFAHVWTLDGARALQVLDATRAQ